MGVQAPPDGARQISAPRFHVGDRRRQTKGSVERTKNFEEDESNSRVTKIISPTDQKPMIETLRGFKSQDGVLVIYKVMSGRKIRKTKRASWSRRVRSARSTDSFPRKRAPPLPPPSGSQKMRRTESGKPNTTSETKSISDRWNHFGRTRRQVRSYARSVRTTSCVSARTANGNKPSGFPA